MSTVPTIVYLAVSGSSLVVQSAALARIVHTSRTVGRPRQGLLRTATCRVAAAVTYVSLGVLALAEVSVTGTAALITLITIQVLWQANAMLDARLARSLERGES